jgi:serine/threonine-protein kinase
MGILLYMMTTGKHPFRGDDQAQTIARISSDEPAVLPSTLVPGYPPGLEACVMQALAKDAAKRYPSANDMLLGLTRALPSAMRESTDEEVSEFIRRLLPDRLERQKQAIKQALEQADRRDVVRPASPLHEVSTDEPATVLEGLSPEMTPSADGRSLPGASSSEPPPSFTRLEAQRRRSLLYVAFAGSLIIVALLSFAFGLDRRPRRSAAAAPPPPPPPALVVHSEPAVTAPPSPVISAEPPVPAAPAPSVSAPTAPPRAVSSRRSGGIPPKPTPSAPPREGPFVSPIRNPGF